MAKETKEFYELLLKKHEVDATVEILDEEITSEILEGIEDDIQTFKAENQKRVQESHQEIQKVVFNA